MCQIPNFADITVIKLGGRPSTFSEATAAALCDRLIAGRSLRQACQGPDMPSKATVMRWLAAPAHESFRKQYQTACWLREHMMLDEILEIADDASRDTITGPRGTPRRNMTAIRRDELRIKTRFWLLNIWRSRKYGLPEVD